MFQFRNVSQKHDRYLKEQYKEMLKTSSVEEIPTTSEAVETKKVAEPKKETKEVKLNYRIHQSVKDLYKIYPQLKLPSTCLKIDVEPWVMMEMDTVENYLKRENRDERKRIRLSKPENRTAKKSTSAAFTSIDPLLISSMPEMGSKKNCASDSFNKIVQKKSEFTTVSIADIHKNINNSDSISDEKSNAIEKITVKPKKRRLSDSDFFSDTDRKSSSSSKPLPKKNPIGESADELCLDKSVPLFICSICNSVHNNVRALKRHNYKHLRCQFCRLKFRSVVVKDAHIKSLCAIKNMMNHLPSIKLKKIELNLEMRNKYPAAFIGYPSTPGLQLNSSSSNETLEDDSSGDNHSDDRISGDEFSGNMTSEKEKHAVSLNDDNVIEIFSDDDTNLLPRNGISNSTPVRQKEIALLPNITQGTMKSETSSTESSDTAIVSSITVPPLVSTVAPNISSIHPFESTTSSIISTTTSPVISSIPSVISTTPPVIASTPIPPTLLTAFEDSLSSSIVKPEIKIKRSTILDSIDPRLTDIKVLKELLTNYTDFKFEKEESSQTELPSNQSICRNESDNSTELKHLKNVLFAYKIPISIKKGEFRVRYDSNSADFKSQQSKKLCQWNDLIPIDVQVVNASHKESSVQDKISITSKVTNPILSSPGITSDCICTPTYPYNPSSFIALPNQQMYGINNSFSTPVDSFNGSSNVQMFPRVISSDYGFVSESPGSKAYVLVRTNTAEQQSNINVANSFTPSSVQMNPQSMNGIPSDPSKIDVANKSVAKGSKNARSGAKLATLSKTPISYLNDMRGPPNMNPFLKVTVPKTSPGLSINSMNSTPPNVGNSHSMIYNLQSSMVIQNKVPNPAPNPVPNPVSNLVPNLVPISSTSGDPNEDVPVVGTIRVKNVWELT